MTLKIYYKSGNSESWIRSVNEKINDQWVKVETPEIIEGLERKYDHIIYEHNHDDKTGYGSFIVTDGIQSDWEYE